MNKTIKLGMGVTLTTSIAIPSVIAHSRGKEINALQHTKTNIPSEYQLQKELKKLTKEEQEKSRKNEIVQSNYEKEIINNTSLKSDNEKHKKEEDTNKELERLIKKAKEMCKGQKDNNSCHAINNWQIFYGNN